MDTPIVDKRNYSDQIFNFLFGEIKDGRIKPGDKLPNERDLSRQLGVSRPSLREALRSMNQLGLVTTTQGGGSYVNNYDDIYLKSILQYMTVMSSDMLIDLLQVRKALETEAARLASIRATDEDLAQIKQIQSARAQLYRDNLNHLENVRAELHDLDYKFHLAIAEASKNKIILVFIESIHATITAHQSQSAVKADLGEITTQLHQEILDALLARDPDKAGAKMHLHLQTVENVLSGTPSADMQR